MTGGKDGTVALWNGDFSQVVHTYEVAPQKFAEGEPRLLSSSPSIRALTVANVCRRQQRPHSSLSLPVLLYAPFDTPFLHA